ncbi:MAG: pyruvate kinase [Lachnospiraceae bacterium]|nr:pyruvate kinase [Ruminococcus sp.]MCM1275526.1 pyruvate kinase [Lachnospiraceae bacterium]
MRRTKIVCTLGPATQSDEVLRLLIESGMDVARQNFSHGTHESHKAAHDQVTRVARELGKPVATLLDTKGPEVRLGKFGGGRRVEIKAGDTFTLTTAEVEGDNERVSVSYKGLPNDIGIGARILIDDGNVSVRCSDIVRGADGTADIICTVLNGGALSDNKGVNIPDVRLSMPYLSDTDIADIRFAAREGFDFVAASFVTCPEDVLAVRKILEEEGRGDIRIIAKIENGGGVRNIDDILRVSDGIMVARGDMGVEIPFEEIPRIQKMLIKKGYNANKQVITATQMLESMMHNPRPTRAETTDVANAIYDGTSAIMLSGETAAGEHPVEAVKTMALIAETTEKAIDYKRRFYKQETRDRVNVSAAISHATVSAAMDLGATAIITVTKTGATARMISRYRPECPIISCTTSEVVWRQSALSWGVVPLMAEEMMTNTDDLIYHAVEKAVGAGLLKSGDLTVITAGVPLGVSGTTNLMKVHIVGDVLVKGTGVTKGSVTAPVCVAQTEEEALGRFEAGQILVIRRTSNRVLPLLKTAAGIVTEESGEDSHAAVVGMALDIPVIVGAENAAAVLRSGTTVTLDADRGIVSAGAGG